MAIAQAERDIVDRLREQANFVRSIDGPIKSIWDNAADEIERLRALTALQRDVPTVKIEDITSITNALLERSGKFSAFFSRAELEEHVAFAMAPQYRKAAAPVAEQSDGGGNG